MADVVVVYHSGYGHTRKQAEAVGQGAEAALIAISAEGDIAEADWARLNHCATKPVKKSSCSSRASR